LNIVLNDYNRTEEWWNENPNLIIDNFKKEFGVEIDIKDIRENDVIVFNICGVPRHFAIYLGGDFILHHPINEKSVINELRCIEGFYHLVNGDLLLEAAEEMTRFDVICGCISVGRGFVIVKYIQLLLSKLKKTNSLLPILERRVPHYSLMLILPMQILRTKFNLFITMKQHALKNMFLQPQALFSSENLRHQSMYTQENQIKNHLSVLLNH
jgi:hypothetical protein